MLALAGAPAFAATTIINSTTLTPENQANFATGTASNLTTGAAFTFTTGSLGAENLLSTIGLEGRNTGSGSNGATITLELWSDTDNNAQTLGGTLIATSINSSLLSLGDVVTPFSFAGVTLADNTVYSVHVLGTSPGFGLVGTTTTDILANSRLFQNGAFVFGGTGTNGIDASFNVVTVPEPSAALLGGLGMLALLRRRRGV